MNQLLQGNWKPHMVAGLNWSSCCSCHCFFGLCMQNSKVYVYVSSRDGGGKWKSTQACTTAPFVNYIICIPSRFASRKMKGKIIFINKIGKQKFILKKLPKLYFLYRLCIHDILYDLTRPLASVPSRKPQLWPFRYLFWLRSCSTNPPLFGAFWRSGRHLCTELDFLFTSLSLRWHWKCMTSQCPSAFTD